MRYNVMIIYKDGECFQSNLRFQSETDALSFVDWMIELEDVKLVELCDWQGEAIVIIEEKE